MQRNALNDRLNARLRGGRSKGALCGSIRSGLLLPGRNNVLFNKIEHQAE